MSALALMATCHPKRRATLDGLCRECFQVASSPADDPLPAIILRTEQHAGPMIPLRCYKCGSVWSSDGDMAECLLCGATFYRTSLRVIGAPGSTNAHAQAAQALRGRGDRKTR